MSINLGNEPIAAVRSLHESPSSRSDFTAVREAIADQARRYMNAAMDSATHVPDLVGAARAMRDLYIALEGAVHNVNPARVEKPGPFAPAKK